MRIIAKPLDAEPSFCRDPPANYECVYSTPAPVLLYICSETRKFALLHYELVFGRPNCYVVVPRHFVEMSCRWPGQEPNGMWVESNIVEVTNYGPKVYFNFKKDLLVCGKVLPPREKSSAYEIGDSTFPYGDNLECDEMRRIERLAVGFDPAGVDSLPFSMLDNFIKGLVDMTKRWGSPEAKLKRLYLLVEADDVDSRRELELVDLRDGDDAMAQKFLDEWKYVFYVKDVPLGKRTEGVKALCSKDTLYGESDLRNLLLEKGASPDEVLTCVCVRNVARGD